MWLTDIAHHHLAIEVIFISAGHLYRTNWEIGYALSDLLYVNKKGLDHSGLLTTITDSLHMQLALALAGLGIAASLTAQHMYALPAYVFISSNYLTQISLYMHHQFIAGFLMTGAFAHGAIFFIRDYNPRLNEGNVLYIMLSHKESIISHLSWVSYF